MTQDEIRSAAIAFGEAQNKALEINASFDGCTNTVALNALCMVAAQWIIVYSKQTGASKEELLQNMGLMVQEYIRRAEANGDQEPSVN